jgi:hypothetical protein
VLNVVSAKHEAGALQFFFNENTKKN